MLSCCRCGSRQSQGGRAALRSRFQLTRLDLAVSEEIDATKAVSGGATGSSSVPSCPSPEIGGGGPSALVSTPPRPGDAGGRVFEGGFGIALEQGDVYMLPGGGQAASNGMRLQNLAGTSTTVTTAPPNTPTTLSSFAQPPSHEVSPEMVYPLDAIAAGNDVERQPPWMSHLASTPIQSAVDWNSRLHGAAGYADDVENQRASLVADAVDAQEDLAAGIQLPPLEPPRFGRSRTFVGGFPVESFGAQIAAAAAAQSQHLPSLPEVSFGPGDFPGGFLGAENEGLPLAQSMAIQPGGGLPDQDLGGPRSFWQVLCCQRRYRPAAQR